MEVENNDVEAGVSDVAPQVEQAPAPAPVQSESPVREAPAQSAREALERAFAKSKDTPAAAVDKPAAAPAKAEAQAAPAVTGEQPRAPDGKFAPKGPAPATETAPVAPKIEQPAQAAPQATPANEPPARFAADAKAAWKDAPAPVQREVMRAVNELEGGLRQYQEAFQPIKPYYDMAQKAGKSLDQVLQTYVGTEQMLRQDPMRGLENIMANLGFTPQMYAAQVMGQPQDQQSAGANRTILELRQTVNAMQQQLGTINSSVSQQQAYYAEQQAREVFNDFSRNHPRVEELRPIMALVMQANPSATLDEAYAQAETIKPAQASVVPPAPAQVAQAAITPNPAAQTRRGSLSVTGAPASGSNPAHRAPAATAREALQRAFAATA